MHVAFPVRGEGGGKGPSHSVGHIPLGYPIPVTGIPQKSRQDISHAGNSMLCVTKKEERRNARALYYPLKSVTLGIKLLDDGSIIN